MASRNGRRFIASDTVRIVSIGVYKVNDSTVNIKAEIQSAIKGTRLYTPDDAIYKMKEATATENKDETRFDVVEGTTLEVAAKLSGDICILNFASAKQPGGGFLNGAQAQEESIARSSSLYACLTSRQCDPFYKTNKRFPGYYTDHAIYSPTVPIFRTDDGRLLEKPYQCAVITCPAVNVNSLSKADKQSTIDEAMQRRINKILTIASVHKHEILVLGAYGCGVFGNQAIDVAGYFAKALTGHKFKRVVFAILDKNMPKAFSAVFKTPVITVKELRF